MDRDLRRVHTRLLGIIFPNTPVTRQERRAFLAACRAQLEYEKELELPRLPAGLQAFEIGHFRAELDGKGTGGVRGLCPEAYALLLRAGLLYRGVER